MASKTQQLYSEIERAQDELRESIEHSRQLVKRSDALIRQVRDLPPGTGNEAPGAG
jgi:hypothetical protein